MRKLILMTVIIGAVLSSGASANHDNVVGSSVCQLPVFSSDDVHDTVMKQGLSKSHCINVLTDRIKYLECEIWRRDVLIYNQEYQLNHYRVYRTHPQIPNRPNQCNTAWLFGLGSR